jgi:hypothetical protein
VEIRQPLLEVRENLASYLAKVEKLPKEKDKGGTARYADAQTIIFNSKQQNLKDNFLKL